MKTLQELREAYNAAVEELNKRIAAIEALGADATDEQINEARTAFEAAKAAADERKADLEPAEALERARGQHKPVEIPANTTPVDGRVPINVDEPDMYVKGGEHRFLNDLFRAQILRDPSANERVTRHHIFEVEKRALATATFGGLIPPNYLLDMYAKAPRNGRVFVDQCNRKDLPDFGMSVIVPRLTQGTAAGIQSAENAALTTQDIVEADLTVPVRTIGGYSPVSRQGLERAQYNEEILMEDLIARYNAAFDVQAINGDGTGVNMLGLLQTVGIKSSAATGSSNLPAVYANIADVIQQIDTAVGGLGYSADKIVLHPRRWGSFVAAVDTTDRPILGITGLPFYNVDGEGKSAGYGYVGQLQGLPVYKDANIPTNLGNGGNEDAIIVMASEIVHRFEREEDPITLAFEQQAGTSLQVQLIAYGYAAFTAGRYPAACGKVTGLVPPTFGS